MLHIDNTNVVFAESLSTETILNNAGRVCLITDGDNSFFEDWLCKQDVAVISEQELSGGADLLIAVGGFDAMEKAKQTGADTGISVVIIPTFFCVEALSKYVVNRDYTVDVLSYDHKTVFVRSILEQNTDVYLHGISMIFGWLFDIIDDAFCDFLNDRDRLGHADVKAIGEILQEFESIDHDNAYEVIVRSIKSLSELNDKTISISSLFVRMGWLTASDGFACRYFIAALYASYKKYVCVAPIWLPPDRNEVIDKGEEMLGTISRSSQQKVGNERLRDHVVDYILNDSGIDFEKILSIVDIFRNFGGRCGFELSNVDLDGLVSLMPIVGELCREGSILKSIYLKGFLNGF